MLLDMSCVASLKKASTRVREVGKTCFVTVVCHSSRGNTRYFEPDSVPEASDRVSPSGSSMALVAEPGGVAGRTEKGTFFPNAITQAWHRQSG